jgi:hypothetical protein
MPETSTLKLDIRLVRAMRRGPGELPADLGMLRGYLRTIALLLSEKASEVEASWPDACVAASEIETLLKLEAVVVERAVDVRARTLTDVQVKLEIWRATGAGYHEEDALAPRTRLIYSVEADLARLAATPRRTD